MRPSEAAALLVKAAAFDRRTIGEADAVVWAEALGDVDIPLAADAITAHYRESTNWIMPNHILRYVRDVEQTRMRDAGTPDYPSGLTLAAEKEYRLAYQAAVKAGQSRDEATATADREFGANRLPEIEAPPHVRRAITEFEQKRKLPRAEPGDAA